MGDFHSSRPADGHHAPHRFRTANKTPRRCESGGTRGRRDFSLNHRRRDLATHFLDALNRVEKVDFTSSLDASGQSFIALRPLLHGTLSPRLALT